MSFYWLAAAYVLEVVVGVAFVVWFKLSERRDATPSRRSRRDVPGARAQR